MASNYSTSSISRISSSAIRESTKELSRQSIRFSKFSKTTKVSEDIMATIEANNLKTGISKSDSISSRSKKLESIYSSHKSKLELMKQSIDSLVNIASQSSASISANERASNNSIFAQVQERVKDISTRLVNENTDLFELSKILRTDKGKIEYDGEVRAPFAVMDGSEVATPLRFKNVPEQGKTGSIECTGVLEGDTITVNTKVFTFKSEATTETDIKIGSSNSETAFNAIIALNKYSGEETKSFIITRDSNNPSRINFEYMDRLILPLTVSSSNSVRLFFQEHPWNFEKFLYTNIMDQDEKKYYAGQIGNITNVEKKLGSTPSEGTNAERLHVDQMSATLYGEPIFPDWIDKGYWKVEFKIGDTDFNGYIYQWWTGTPWVRSIYVIRKDVDIVGTDLTGKVARMFFLEEAPSASSFLTPGGNADLNFVSSFNLDASRTVIKQSRYLKTNLGENIFFKQNKIGSTEGMSAFYTSTDRHQLAKSFDIEDISIDESYKMTIKTKDSSGEENEFSAVLSSLVTKGSRINFTSDNGDEISILVGKDDINLSKKSYREQATRSMQKLFGMQDFDPIANFEFSKLTGFEELDISSETNASTALNSLKTASKKLTVEIAKLNGEIENLAASVEKASAEKSNLEPTITELTSLNVSDAIKDVDSNMQRYNAAVSMVSTDVKLKQLNSGLLRDI
jgi:hypothetical protein